MSSHNHFSIEEFMNGSMAQWPALIQNADSLQAAMTQASSLPFAAPMRSGSGVAAYEETPTLPAGMRLSAETTSRSPSQLDCQRKSADKQADTAVWQAWRALDRQSISSLCSTRLNELRAMFHRDAQCKLVLASSPHMNNSTLANYARTSLTLLKSRESSNNFTDRRAEIEITFLEELLSALSVTHDKVSLNLNDTGAKQSVSALSSDQASFQNEALLDEGANWASNEPFDDSIGEDHQVDMSITYPGLVTPSSAQAPTGPDAFPLDGTDSHAGLPALGMLNVDSAQFDAGLAGSAGSSATGNVHDLQPPDFVQPPAHDSQDLSYDAQSMTAATGGFNDFTANSNGLVVDSMDFAANPSSLTIGSVDFTANSNDFVADPMEFAANSNGFVADPMEFAAVDGFAPISNDFTALPNGLSAVSNDSLAGLDGFAANAIDFTVDPNGFAANPNGFAAGSNGFAANLNSFATHSNGFVASPNDLTADPNGFAPNFNCFVADSMDIAADSNGFVADSMDIPADSNGFAAGQIDGTSFDTSGLAQVSPNNNFSSYPLSQNSSFMMESNMDAATNLQLGLSGCGGFAANPELIPAPMQRASPVRPLSLLPSAIEPMELDTNAQVSRVQVAERSNSFSYSNDSEARFRKMLLGSRPPRHMRSQSLYGTGTTRLSGPGDCGAYHKAQAEAVKNSITAARQIRPEMALKLRTLARQEITCHARVERIREAENLDIKPSSKLTEQAMVTIHQARRMQSRAQRDTQKQRRTRERLAKVANSLAGDEGPQMTRTEHEASSATIPSTPSVQVHSCAESVEPPAHGAVSSSADSWKPTVRLGTPRSSTPQAYGTGRPKSTPRKKKKSAEASSSKAPAKKTTAASSSETSAKEITEAST
jgi:hypothetical protein